MVSDIDLWVLSSNFGIESALEQCAGVCRMESLGSKVSQGLVFDMSSLFIRPQLAWFISEASIMWIVSENDLIR